MAVKCAMQTLKPQRKKKKKQKLNELKPSAAFSQGQTDSEIVRETEIAGDWGADMGGGGWEMASFNFSPQLAA